MNISQLASKESLSGLSDYLRFFEKYHGQVSEGTVEADFSLRVAFISSFMANGIPQALFTLCAKEGIASVPYVGAYNQYAQEILDPKSGLYASRPDVVILFLDARELAGTLYLQPYSVGDSERKEWAAQKAGQLASFCRQITSRTPATIIINNLEVPSHSPLGVLEGKQGFGAVEMFQSLNSHLREEFKGDGRIFVFDYDSFLSGIGKRTAFDPKMYYLGDIKLDPRHFGQLASAYMAYLRPLAGKARKCLVLDLDNTLWGGVIGEDGLEGIQLGPTPAGRPFTELQETILALHQRGVILAINSKNNPQDAYDVFRKHPHMLLKEPHFAAIRLNWEDKASNLRAIASELNIGLDSLVFLDDDPLNREWVKAQLPQVLCVDLPKDPSQYARVLSELNVFDTLQLTEEDREKGRMYVQERQRKQVEQASVDVDGYLKALGITVAIKKADSFSIPRIAQLTQKTNQFNATTRRYSEADIQRMASDPNFLVVSVQVADKFGDSGITGVAIVKKGAGTWLIDSFLLSCRVLGRKVENALLAYLLEQAKKGGALEMAAGIVDTPKNAPVRAFYPQNGFEEKSNAKGVHNYNYALSKPYSYPDYLKVTTPE